MRKYHNVYYRAFVLYSFCSLAQTTDNTAIQATTLLPQNSTSNEVLFCGGQRRIRSKAVPLFVTFVKDMPPSFAINSALIYQYIPDQFCFTTRIHSTVLLPIFAVIVTSPGRRAVTLPFLSTSAIRASDDCQIAT